MPSLDMSPPSPEPVELLETASLRSTPKPSPTKRQLHHRLIQLDSPRFSSQYSTTSTRSRSKRFDERIRSRFSALVHTPEIDPFTASSTARDKDPVRIKDLKWANLNTLNTLLRSTHSRSIYGDPTCVTAGDIVALGTSKGYVLVFDYRQILVAELGKGTDALVWGTVTSMTLSLDSTHIAAGYDSGDVLIWDLKYTTRPKVHIEPLKEITDVSDGHIKGSAIKSLTFIGKRHTVLVSTDVNGMVMYHQCNRGVLGFTVNTRRILGKYEDIEPMKLSSILACAALPLGTYVQYTDKLGFVAVMSTSSLLILSTTNSVKTQFKTGRPRVMDSTLPKSGCLAWFPAVVLKEGVKLPARLAYCFNNVLTVLEVSSIGETLQFESKRRWVSGESILGVQWVNQSILALVSNTQQLTLLNEKNMKVTATVDLLPKHLYRHDLYSRLFAHADLLDDFSNSFKTFKGKLFLIGKYEVCIGSVPSWVDLLLDLINEGKYIKAIEVATKYYMGEGDLETIGIPTNSSERQRIVLKYLIDVIKASATHVLNSDLVNINDSEVVREFPHVAIRALISINAGSVVFEELFDIFRDGHLEYFFEALEPFILNRSCRKLTPVILKEMVRYYTSVDKKEVLEQSICLLDIQSLDIDFTLSLLKKNHLRDSHTFIWNVLIHDYITPFLEMIQEVQRNSEDAYKVFGYLAYILTGRQYPTEDLIREPEAEDTKLSLYFVLFNGLPIIYENGKVKVDESIDSGMVFPYLHLLAKFDSKAFLSAMNECLEDSLLNDDEIVHCDCKLKLNRQFIFQILIELFSSDIFDDFDRLNFAIFVARNYPKFHQFIRLSERTLDNTLKTLCSYDGDEEETREDCELSLQSLLSAYQPPNRNELLNVFEKSGFNDILLNLYLNDRKYSKVFEVWLRLDKGNSIDTTDGVLEKCFKSTVSMPKERALLEQVIRDNLTEVIESDTFKIVKILNKYAPKMHKLCLDITDDQLKYLYLFALVQLESQGDCKVSVDERTEYVKCMGTFDKHSLLTYVQTLNKADINIDKCISELREAGCVETIVYLLNKDGNFKGSLEEVIAYMRQLLDRLPLIVQRSDREELDRVGNELWQQLRSGITLANHDGPQTQTTTGTHLSLNEDMWLSLINFIVDQLKRFDTGQHSPKAVDIVKRLLQDLFSSLINTRSQISSIEIDSNGVNRSHSSFLKIFTEFLNSSSVHVTVLGDVRFVTNEIFLALSYEKSILTITSKLIDDDIYQNMERLAENNLVGWSALRFECDACGKIIWGRHLSPDIHRRWEERQKHPELGNVKDVNDLVTFNCRHCYHRSCLEKFGNKDSYNCVICSSENQRPDGIDVPFEDMEQHIY
jgi:hypothetical protein